MRPRRAWALAVDAVEPQPPAVRVMVVGADRMASPGLDLPKVKIPCGKVQG